MIKTKSVQLNDNDMNIEREYASKEEKYFTWWLDQLVKGGYILDYEYEPVTFNLSGEVCYYWEKVTHLKTKTKIEKKKQALLKPHNYTPDFAIHWTKEAIGVFCNTIDQLGDPKTNTFFLCDDQLTTIVEIKPNFDMNNMTRLARVNIKLVYEIFQRHVQLVYVYPKVSPKGKITPEGTLFESTFVPYKYLSTDESGKLRKIRFDYKTFDQFLGVE